MKNTIAERTSKTETLKIARRPSSLNIHKNNSQNKPEFKSIFIGKGQLDREIKMCQRVSKQDSGTSKKGVKSAPMQ